MTKLQLTKLILKLGEALCSEKEIVSLLADEICAVNGSTKRLTALKKSKPADFEKRLAYMCHTTIVTAQKVRLLPDKVREAYFDQLQKKPTEYPKLTASRIHKLAAAKDHKDEFDRLMKLFRDEDSFVVMYAK